MPETTPEFHNLLLSLATARKILDGLDDHHINCDLDEIKLKSYVLLRHAAFEEYLERASLYAARECKKIYDRYKTVPEPLASICAYYKVDAIPYMLSSSNTYRAEAFFGHVCQRAIECHADAIDAVHGIKTKDQDTIFNPLGIKIHDFDSVLSQKLHSIGRNRGGVAHQFRIRQLQPRSAVLSDTLTLLNLLQSFDNEICRRITVLYSF